MNRVYHFLHKQYLLKQILFYYLCTMKIENVIKQATDFKSNHHKMLVNMIYTGNWLRDEHMRIFKQFDLLPQHYNVLRIIKGSMPNPITPRDIKEVLIDKASDLTRLIDKLTKLGYVKRNLCPSNRRQMDISLTEQGLALMEEMDKPLEEFIKKVEANISGEQAGQLSDLLDTLRG